MIFCLSYLAQFHTLLTIMSGILSQIFPYLDNTSADLGKKSNTFLWLTLSSLTFVF